MYRPISLYTEDRDDENIICPNCGGTGSQPYLNCPCKTCHGTGMIQDSYEVDEDEYQPSGDANDAERDFFDS